VNTVSSTPSRSTPASRAGSSTGGCPSSRTAAITVAHPTPNYAATEATVCPSRPTRRHASFRGRSVSDARARIASDCSVQGGHLALLVVAPPDPLDPHQRDRPTRRWQVPHPHLAPVVQLGDHSAAGAADQVRRRHDGLLDLMVEFGHRDENEPG
jgi:hypothetical protein